MFVASTHPMITLAVALGAGVEKLALSVMILDLALIYLTALLGGEVFRRLGLPSLSGALIGGLVVGISGLQLIVLPDLGFTAADAVTVNWVAHLHSVQDPAVLNQVFSFQGEFLRNLADVGAVVLLFEVGLGANLNQVLANRSQIIAVAGLGVLLSLIGCSLTLNAFWQLPLQTSLFMGAALTVTSLGITVQLLLQSGSFSAIETQVIIGAAMLDDVIGVLLLALVLGLYQEGNISSLTILRLLAGTTLALLVAIALGRWLSPLLMRMQQSLVTRGSVIVPALIFTFLFALVASVAQLPTIFGAFMAGLVLQGSIRRLIIENLRPVVDAFIPIFFVYIGAATDLRLLLPWISPEAGTNLALAGFLCLVASGVKLVSGYALSPGEGINPLRVGLGMIPRGEIGLVFAELGRVSRILSPALFTTLVLISILTTLVAGVGLRFAKPLRSPVASSGE
jgi:Kef-type K+ transport system membrane component KefB